MSVITATGKMRMGRTIKISEEVHKRLVKVGGKSESFSDVVSRLLDCYEEVMDMSQKSESFSDVITRLVEHYEISRKKAQR